MHLRDGLQPHSTVAQRYAHLVETGEIAEDPAQRPVVAALDHLIDEIRAKRLARKSSALGWLFAKNRSATEPVTKAGKDATLADVKANDVVTVEAAKGAGDTWTALKISVT